MLETKVKVARVRRYLRRHKLAAGVFLTRANFAWLSGGGDNHVASQSDAGVAALVVTTRQLLVVTSRIEAARIIGEEHLAGWTLREHSWTTPLPLAIKRALGGSRAAADDPGRTGLPPLPGDFADEVRAELTEFDIARYKALGRDCVLAVETVARQLNPGDSGCQVEADLARHLLARGIQPHVILVGFDDRLRKYRHPIPTANHLRHHAMLVIGGKRHGLIACLTRCVYFGPLPPDVRLAHDAVCRVEAAMWQATIPGATWAAAFKAGVRQYRKEGFAKEWELHHQGGPTGFAGRDFYANASEQRQIQLHQAVAWNPSITGAKSEDTCIVTASGLEVITAATPAWPMVRAVSGRMVLRRPDILLR